MTPLPLTAFPIAVRTAGSSTFVVAVLVGLAMYIAAQKTPKTQPKS